MTRDRRTVLPLRRTRLAALLPPPAQQPTRFCSRSTLCFTLGEARGYLRPTSTKVAQAASFSLSAASDCPRRTSASGALLDFSNLVETVRKDSAASRKRWRWNRLSPTQ